MNMNYQENEVRVVIEKLFRTQYGKVISYLTSKFGLSFLENAEDVVQETLSVAFQKWAFDGIPDNPEAWIFVVARNKAYNLVKKDQKKSEIELSKLVLDFTEKEDQIFLNQEIEDNMLRIILHCCSLELATESKILFILSCLCGFSRKELAQALLMKEETVKKRLFRAKKTIRLQKHDLSSSNRDTLKNQTNVICNILYILYNEGYNSSSKKSVIRKDICFEAMRLTKLLLNHFSDNPRVHALFALMCLHSARFESRIDEKGAIVLFKDQNRELWNEDLINSGIFHLSKSAAGSALTSYHLEAAIAAEHCIAQDFESTNWKQILTLYKKLHTLKPSPVILLNVAIVKSMLGHTSEAIHDLLRLQKNSVLHDNYLLHATLAELLASQEKFLEAISALKLALERTNSPQEKALLSKKLKALKAVC